MSPFTPSLRLHDRYVLRERIGRGGMSEVWRAHDEVLHRPVAVKALAGELAADPQLRATIQREARAAARLSHPHVTQVYDYGEASLAGGAVVPYLVMELVDGHNLADRLAAGPLPWPEAVRMAAQVAAALADAHRIGVVHRDIKPGNVMLTATGAKVLDFGIAALAGPDHPLAGQTGELLMGTPAYFAPERMRPGPPNPASDVYALGALLYRTLTGRAHLRVDSWEDAVDVHARGATVPPPAVPGLPADVARLTLACLAADPARRPTAAQLAAHLRATRPAAPPANPPTAILPSVAASTPAHAPTLVDRRPATPDGAGPRPPAPTRAPARRSDRPVAALVAAGLALVVATVAALVLGDRGDQAPTAGRSVPVEAPSSSPAPRPSTAAPTTAGPAPVNLREVAAEFAAVLALAVAQGDVDRKTAEQLGRDLVELGGRPRDRAERVEKLRERLDKAVEDGKLDPTVAAQLDALLADTGGTRRDG
ncbi:serine/threonine-protein kinase [Micromonospora sp. WMMD558]|uniref:serine/threonine-protein kinase n=1 Tax=unclassified Micromonospora TaxID=2617518 RepID=UPI0012B4A98C|nr:serine/threonine-protein kinase [Micromonospora sp. WMMC415]QGN49117.1 protein kinase [Micromonospora sp. WMMC415]